MPLWVADIAHDPREDIDDEPENQCQRYREGEASHFVELTPGASSSGPGRSDVLSCRPTSGMPAGTVRECRFARREGAGDLNRISE